jgi:hypothetical protein
MHSLGLSVNSLPTWVLGSFQWVCMIRPLLMEQVYCIIGVSSTCSALCYKFAHLPCRTIVGFQALLDLYIEDAFALALYDVYAAC